MDVTLQRTESDRSQNGGPRVSFNRDVHVKRIGPRPPLSDPIGTSTPTSTASVFRRELPTDLSAEGIRKEAAKVLAQVDSVQCTAEGASNDIVGGRANIKSRGPIEKRRNFDYNTNKIFNNNSPKDQGWHNPNRFNSLPNRKPKSKSGSKPVARSVSDASAKNSAAKRPSIFSIFSRKSDSNLNESSVQDGQLHAKNAAGGNQPRKRVGRSKSDVGTLPTSRQQLRKRNNSENEDQQLLVGGSSSAPKKNRAPLSPIIEQSQKEDYFSAEAKLSVPPPPPVVPPKRRDKRNGNRSTISGTSAKRPEVDIERRQEDNILAIAPAAKPVAEAIKDTISTLKRSNSRTALEMHSSQQPQTKPPLTKGVTVDGMVKRLSMERFSPPPHLSGPAFSYTRPKDQIIYAQVVCDPSDGKSKQTVHSSYENGTTGHDTVNCRGPSPFARIGVNSPSSHHLDAVDGHVKTNTTNTSQHRQTQHFRHNSDEDEGLGLEIKARAVNDDFIPTHDRRYGARDQPLAGSDDEFKSVVAEDLPITPKIRDVPPEKYVFHTETVMRGRGDGVEGHEFGDLSQRRAVLESRIHNRRFGSRDLLTEQAGDEDKPLFKNPAYNQSQEYPTGEPVRMTKVSTTMTPITNRDYVKRLSPPSRETDHHHHHEPQSEQNQRYQRSRSMDVTSAGAGDRHKQQQQQPHRLGSQELVDRYSPERSHLDMVGKYAPNGVTSKYEEESRYYHDGRDGYKETIHRETNIGPDGKPRVTESVSRERLDTPPSNRGRDDYYRDKYVKETPTTVVPDSRRPIDTQHGEDDLIGRQHYHHRQEWRSSSEPSRRHQKLQRSFDRGDSGIENDYRKDSFNDRDLRSKWKQRTYDDDRRTCDLFLRKERRHTVENHPVQWTRSYGYKERSIDDGSHFDPRLDKYVEEEQGTLRRRREKSAERHAAEKKKSGLEKVRQLLSGGSSKKNKSSQNDGTLSSSSLFTTGGSSTLKSDKLTKERRHHIPGEDHQQPPPPRSRFSESRTSETSVFVEPQIPDISTRRRLSTPKASPALPKRTSSQKSYKSSSTGEQQPKLSWFKSLDRLSRKKDKAQLPPSSRTSSVEERVNGHHTLKPSRSTHEDTLPGQGQVKGNSSKTLRFFGDTDLESNGSYSKASWKNKTRQPLTSQKAISKSAFDLDTINHGRMSSSKHKSTSLQHLDETDRSNGRHMNGKYNSKSRDLHDISESASDNELAASLNHHHHQPQHHMKKTTHHSSSLLSDSSYNKSREQSPKLRSSLHSSRTAAHPVPVKAATLNRNGKLSYDDQERGRGGSDHGRRSASVDARISTLSRHDYRKPPPAPQKPARTFEKRRSVSRGERDRVQDSSGTEGDSSQVSRGSVVFLHATTVGDIPQPQWLSSRSRAASRDSLSSKSTKNQPMTRTVSRSYSVLSPWTPRHLRDGYEINYSQQTNNNNNHSMKSNKAKASATTQKQGSSSTSTLPKSSKTRSNTNTLTRYKKHNHTSSSPPNNKLPRTHDQPFDNSSPPKSSNNRHHSGYRPAALSTAAMDRPVERKIIQQRRAAIEEQMQPDRYSRRHRTLTPEPVSRYN